MWQVGGYRTGTKLNHYTLLIKISQDKFKIIEYMTTVNNGGIKKQWRAKPIEFESKKGGGKMEGKCLNIKIIVRISFYIFLSYVSSPCRISICSILLPLSICF